MDAIVWRSVERIVGVMIGALSIYLGFRLFLAMPDRSGSEGKFAFPGGISIYLTRVGPGVFFALFGAVVVAISFYKTPAYKESFEQTNPSAQNGGGVSKVSRIVSYTGFGDAGADMQLRRMQAASDIKLLNAITAQLLRKDLSGPQRTDVELAIPRLKLALVKSVWDSKWGDFAAFEEWVEAGAAGSAPNGLAARLFLRGEI